MAAYREDRLQEIVAQPRMAIEGHVLPLSEQTDNGRTALERSTPTTPHLEPWKALVFSSRQRRARRFWQPPESKGIWRHSAVALSATAVAELSLRRRIAEIQRAVS